MRTRARLPRCLGRLPGPRVCRRHDQARRPGLHRSRRPM